MMACRWCAVDGRGGRLVIFLAAFRHRAFYDPGPRWIEMRLRAEDPQRARLPGSPGSPIPSRSSAWRRRGIPEAARPACRPARPAGLRAAVFGTTAPSLC